MRCQQCQQRPAAIKGLCRPCYYRQRYRRQTAYFRTYYQQHKARIRARQRQYYYNHQRYFAAKRREYAAL